MAKFVADATLAAMSKRAHDVLRGRNLNATPAGQVIPAPPPKVTQPTAMYGQMVRNQQQRAAAALAGLTGRYSGALDALRVNPRPAPRGNFLQRMAASGRDMQGLGGRINMKDFERGFSVPGYSGEQLVALAASQAPSYGGHRYVPHNLAAEAQVFTDEHGKRYIRVKFADPTGVMATSTENVYIDQ